MNDREKIDVIEDLIGIELEGRRGNVEKTRGMDEGGA
jgi:hypothetical protein